jgi:hypothetical protein
MGKDLARVSHHIGAFSQIGRKGGASAPPFQNHGEKTGLAIREKHHAMHDMFTTSSSTAIEDGNYL